MVVTSLLQLIIERVTERIRRENELSKLANEYELQVFKREIWAGMLVNSKEYLSRAPHVCSNTPAPHVPYDLTNFPAY